MKRQEQRCIRNQARYAEAMITLRSGGDVFLQMAAAGFDRYANTHTSKENRRRFAKVRARFAPKNTLPRQKAQGVFPVRRRTLGVSPHSDALPQNQQTQRLAAADQTAYTRAFFAHTENSQPTAQSAQPYTRRFAPENPAEAELDELTQAFPPLQQGDVPSQEHTRQFAADSFPYAEERNATPETRQFNRHKQSKTTFFSRSREPDVSEAALYAPGGRSESLFVERSKPRSFALGTFFATLKVALLLLLCVGLVGLGVLKGVLTAYANTAPELDITMITDQDQSSTLYDIHGKAITTMMLYRNSEWATLDEIPDMLQNAFIAVEDVRFYRHDGIDLKRIASAAIGTLTGNFDGGGSTITQQLIKLQITGSEQSYRRKVQEASLAMELEEQYSKEQILEYYLNSVPLGAQNYGVKAAAKDYFGKELGELSIRECAMIGGLTQNPSKYDPRQNTYKRKADSMDVTNTRTDTVLRRMYTAGFISKEQLESALGDTVHIVEVSDVKRVYDMAYFVEYAIHDVITHFLEMRNLQDNKKNRADMEREILTGGYKIYTTVDPDIQNTVQNLLSNWQEYPALRDSSKAVVVETLADGTTMETPQPQAATVILDPHSGQIRAMIGGRDEPQQRKLWNRAYQSHMEVGSSIKPISVYGPALEMGASPASIYLNYEAPIEGYGGENGHPSGGLQSQGPVTMRYGIEKSYNVVAARTLFETVGVESSARFLMRMGVDESSINTDGPGLALGTSAISPLEMAAAYATIANGGTYIQPISFTRVESSRGEVLLDAQAVQTRTQIFSPATCWLLTDMLKGAIEQGTGTRAAIENMHVAGKTGTNNDYRSVYFAGYTPYYVSALWVGHDDGRYKLQSGASGGTYAAPLWQAYMSAIHQGLVDKDFFAAAPEELGLVERTVCAVSGQLATDACKMDHKHAPVTDWFVYKNVPTENCQMHRYVRVDSDSGKLAPADMESARGSVRTVVPNEPPWSSLDRSQWRSTLTNAVSGGEWSSSQNATPGSEAYDKYYADNTEEEVLIEEEDDSTSGLIDNARSILAGDYVYSAAQGEELMTLISTLESLMANDAADAAMASFASRLQELILIIENQTEGNLDAEQTDEEVEFNEYGEIIEFLE